MLDAVPDEWLHGHSPRIDPAGGEGQFKKLVWKNIYNGYAVQTNEGLRFVSSARVTSNKALMFRGFKGSST
ncbi:MAG: hypothetical protein H6887_17610 [Hoeflea sp.]|nr:hypothetical protein [Hoeflea sp.]